MGKKLSTNFLASLQQELMTYRNSSKAKIKTPVELVLGQKIRPPTVLGFDVSVKNYLLAMKHESTAKKF